MTTDLPFHSVGSRLLSEKMELMKLRDEDVATRVGCSQPHVSRLRRGLRSPARPLALRLRDQFDIPLSAWFEERHQ